MKSLDLEHREIRNLRGYSDIWGESCPTNELPYLIVFRGLDFEAAIEKLINERVVAELKEAEYHAPKSGDFRINEYLKDRIKQLAKNSGGETND